MAIVCVVGENLRSDPTLFARAVTSLDRIPLRLVSQAASRRNITFVLRDADVPEAMNRLHAALFRGSRAAKCTASAACAFCWSATARWGGSSASLAPRVRLRGGRHRRSAVAGALRPIDDAAAGATSTWRSTSRRPTRCSANVPALARRRHQRRPRHDRLAGARSGAPPGGRRGRVRHRGRPEFLDRRRAVRGDGRRRRRGCSRPAEPFGAFLHEAHHAMKKDAPSGTALLLKRTMEKAGYSRPIDVSSTRAGFIPGNAHDRFRRTVGIDYAVAYGPRSRARSRAAR